MSDSSRVGWGMSDSNRAGLCVSDSSRVEWGMSDSRGAGQCVSDSSGAGQCVSDRSHLTAGDYGERPQQPVHMRSRSSSPAPAAADPGPPVAPQGRLAGEPHSADWGEREREKGGERK